MISIKHLFEDFQDIDAPKKYKKRLSKNCNVLKGFEENLPNFVYPEYGTELFEEDEVDYREESLTKISNEAEEMFEKFTGRDGGSGEMNEMDALKDVLSQFTEKSDMTFIEKHLMDKYDLGNA